MTIGRKEVVGLGRRVDDEFDLQAGSRGLPVGEVVSRYLRTPGHLIATIRFFAGLELETVAHRTGIAVKQLREYEKGVVAPSLKDLHLLSREYGANIRVLLSAFGHIAQDASNESLGMAAQFGGALSTEEKLDLKTLVREFADAAKRRR